MDYFLSIDQGTTSTRCILFDQDGGINATHQIEFKQIFPDNKSVEHDANEILETVKTCIQYVTKGVEIESIKSIGITNQRETTVAWSKSTGKPLYNAIVWQDTRTQDICDELIADNLSLIHI